jgi:hypothetical protein
MCELAKLLNPNRFSAMSGKMAAIVGCIIGEPFTSPYLAELVVTSDGFVMGRASDDCGCNQWIGSETELRRNWLNLLDAAGLTDEQRTLAEACYSRTVRHC